MKGTESFKQTIHSYLEQRASEDTLFAEKYHAVNRSIDDIVTYILNEVMKSECHGFDDDEIYSLAIHAAEEKDLEVGKSDGRKMSPDNQKNAARTTSCGHSGSLS